MALTWRQFWMMVHLGLGVVFIHAFAGGLAALARPRDTRLGERVRRLSSVAMASVAWLTVFTGTFITYPWYRAKPAEGTSTIYFPQRELEARPEFSSWHTFSMEWKEHVGWLVPFLATTVAFVILRHGLRVRRNVDLRRTTVALFMLAFFAAVRRLARAPAALPRGAAGV